MSKVEYNVCDVKDCKEKATHVGKQHSVIFHTEQTEGRSVKPYASLEILDLCKKHKKQVDNGDTLHGYGSMGYNTYYLSKGEEYWRKRCKAAEKVIEESPCDPDITREQIKAISEWNKIKEQ